MSISSFIIKRAVPLPKVEDFSHYLFVGPHPDDIEIGAGATIARLVSLGKRVSFLICLDGRFGLDYAPEGTTPDELAGIRKEESLRSAASLGVTDVHFLELSDGGLYDTDRLFDLIAKKTGEIKPDIMFAPDPCVSSECHADHLNVGEAVRRIGFFAHIGEIMEEHGAEAAPVKAVAFYMTAKPNRFVKTSKYIQKQLSAILCHESQFPKDSDAFASLKTYISLRAVDFGLRSFKGKAEGFRILGGTHMHCLPEAGL